MAITLKDLAENHPRGTPLEAFLRPMPVALLVALGSGAVLSTAFVTSVNLGVWVGLAGAFCAASVQTPRRAALVWAAFGATFFGISLAWLSVVTWAGYMGLVLYHAAWAAALGFALALITRNLRFPLSSVAPALWVTGEYVRARLLGGFPWATLAHPLGGETSFVQIASLAGEAGVSFLVVMVNAAVAELLLQMPGRKILFVPSRVRFRSTAYMSAILSACLVLASCVYGTMRVLRDRLEDGPTFALVQGAVPTPARSLGKPEEAAAVDARLLDAYSKLTGEVAPGGADAVIWPESALPGVFGDGSPEERRMRDLSSAAGLPILFGANAYVRAGSSDQTNSAILLNGGELAGRYDKEHLVPFGEYIPFGGLGLRFLRRPLTGDYAAGGEHQPPLCIGPWKAGVTICYEDIFAPLVRRRVLAGADVVVNLTNDSWFDSTAEPMQHCWAARLRAIELGVSMVRATNTGVTCVIDPHGTMTTGPDLCERGRLVAVVKLRAARRDREAAPGNSRAAAGHPKPTWYLAHGELFALSCAVSAMALLAAAALRRRPAPHAADHSAPLSRHEGEK